MKRFATVSPHLIQIMYTYTWKKYLPVIRLLLKKSATSDQSMTLNRIDFEKTNKLRKPACSFSIELKNARLSTINQSAPAKDLLEILMQDDGARTLLRGNHYTISLNSDFVFSIKNLSPVADPVSGGESREDGDAS